MSRSEVGCHVHDTVRIDLIGYQELVAGRQFVVDLYDRIAVDDFACRTCYVEVTAGDFPYFETFRVAASVVVIVRCAPEIRLDTETFVEVFRATHFVRGNDAGFLVEYEVYFG